MANWVNQEKVGREGNKAVWMNLDYVSFIMLEKSNHPEYPDKLHVTFSHPVVDKPQFKDGVAVKGEDGKTVMEETNRWTVYDKETQEKIMSALNGQ